MPKDFDTDPSAQYDASAYMKRSWGKFEGCRDDDAPPHPKHLQSVDTRVGGRVDPVSSAELKKLRKRDNDEKEALRTEVSRLQRENSLLAVRTTETWQNDQHAAEIKYRDNEIQMLQHEKAALRAELDRMAEILSTPQGRDAAVHEAAENMVRVLAGWWNDESLQKAYDQLLAALTRARKGGAQ